MTSPEPVGCGEILPATSCGSSRVLAQVEILDQHSVKVKERLKADEVVPNLDKVPPWVRWGGAPRVLRGGCAAVCCGQKELMDFPAFQV